MTHEEVVHMPAEQFDALWKVRWFWLQTPDDIVTRFFSWRGHCMVQDYTGELKTLLKSVQTHSESETDRFHRLAVEAIQLRDKHIC